MDTGTEEQALQLVELPGSPSDTSSLLVAAHAVKLGDTRHPGDKLNIGCRSRGGIFGHVQNCGKLENLAVICTLRGRLRGQRARVIVIDFWYSIGSTYTYLSVMRLAEVARSSRVSFRWRPFNVRHIMVEQNNIPFKDKPVKTAYMWRDVERRARHYGLAPTVPAPYPLPGLVLANQIAVLGVAEGWVEQYTRAAYRRWFEGGEPAGEEPNMSMSLQEAGQEPDRAIELAQSAPIVAALAEATAEAMALGVFGSPTFVVAGEVFWGDDRLDDAIRWANR